MSEITHLRSLRLAAEDPTELVRFYADVWGLQRVEADEEGVVYLRGTGAEHHLLALVAGPARALERISFGAATAADVDALAERLRSAGVALEEGPGPRQEAGGGYAVVFRDPEGRRLEVSAGLEEHADAGDARIAASKGAGPDRLSHIVLNAPEQAASKAFYTDVLGFRISDWYEDELMVFLRCNPQHHCIVLTPNTWPTLNHVAFEVDDVDAVMSALGRLRKAGLESIWGPGRHGPGGNVFAYFTDPAGNVIEYTAELVEVDDATWTPHEWERSPQNADVWGTSGGVNPDVAAAMANPPAGAVAEGR